MDVMEGYREQVEENIEYDLLMQRYPYDDLDEIVDLMVEVLCTQEDFVKIGRKQVYTCLAKERFLKLDASHIEYVLDCMRDTRSDIRNIKAYLLEVLFNAPATAGNYYKAQVNYDFRDTGYNDIWVEVLTDGVRSGYHAEQDGLLMWEGSYLSRTSESVFSWAIVTEMTENLIERGEYKIKLGLQNAPAMVEQLTLFGVGVEEPAYEVSTAEPTEPLFPGQQVPQAVIDRALYTAGNEPNSAFRVAVFYMWERPEKENVEFLRREFGKENGRGIEYEGRKYAVWFMEDGIHLAQGDSIRTGYRKTLVTWEQASARILELLEAGTYLSAGELEQTQDNTSSPLPYSVIEAATGGNVDAIHAVLTHYSRYICALATRTLYDENGVPHLCVDEELRKTLEIKLITKILDFKLLRAA